MSDPTNTLRRHGAESDHSVWQSRLRAALMGTYTKSQGGVAGPNRGAFVRLRP
jgi:hypothetical protein